MNRRDDPIEYAAARYEQAVFGGDPSGLDSADRALDGVEAEVALARGRLRHAALLGGQQGDDAGASATAADELALFERALALYQKVGDVRGESEALFWLGAFHQVLRDDHDTALSLFERSYALATEVDDTLTRSYALRHLGVVAHRAGRLDEARSRLERSTALRREIGFLPGVAANLVGLTYVALGQGRRDDARDLIGEAEAIARASEALGVLKTIDAAKAVLDEDEP